MELTALRPPHTLFRQIRIILLIPIVLLSIGACYLYGRVIEVNWLRIKHVDIPVQNLPAAFEGFRIVQLSDLHVTEIGKREKKLPDMVNSLGADAIFLTGDYAQTNEEEVLAASIISKLEAKHGMWGVLGNWDSDRTFRLMEAAGVTMLVTEADMIQKDDAQLGIIGLNFDDAMRVVPIEEQRYIISRLKERLPGGVPIILLEHMPRIIDGAKEEDIDLVLSGHTHGGQVRIPFGPAIESPSDMGVWRSKGLFKYKKTYLYINPGIGLEPGPDWIRVRFWCRPEITVVELVKA
jgi:predicted MPP superfamily phosphohydrolase